MPDVFHNTEEQSKCHGINHSPEEQRICLEPSLQTFVDDGYIVGTKEDDESYQEAIHNTMKRIHNYMSANRLVLNEDKSQIMLLTSNKEF